MKTQVEKSNALIFFCLLFLINIGFCQQVDSLVQQEQMISDEMIEFDNAISFFKKTNDALSLAYAYEEKAKVLESHAMYAAIDYYKKALEIYTRLSDEEDVIRVTQLLASNYYIIDDYKSSLKEYYTLLAYYEENQDTLNIARTQSSIGSLYNDLSQPELSLKHQLLALNMAVELEQERGVAAISNNIASLYFDQDSVKLAFEFVRHAEKINKKTDNEHWLSINYSQYADFYLDLGQYDSAKYYLNKSNDYVIKHGNAADSIDMFRKNGVYYFYTDNTAKAISEFNKGVLLSRRIGSIKSESNLNHWLSEVHESLGNMDLTLSYLRSYYELLDSLSTYQSTKRLEEFETLYEVKELENVLSETKLNQKITQQEAEKNHTRFLTFLALSGFLLIIAAIVFLQYRKQVKTNQTLLKLNMATVNTQEVVAVNNDNEKYAKSTLTDDKKEEILKRFTALVVDEELFKDQELKLETVAKRLSVSRTYLSQVINETYDQNFNAYINYCRINLAKKYLLMPKYEMYSIKGIAETVGFKSISAFNTAFKKITGLTPSYYRKNANHKGKV